ncbi:hypothetical protein QF037_003189 [Streptomyces canus]|uniref:peptidase inhibitor family I36 protein n=1 Tax=Streptomyces canus TaxID=58343 RepID=UPI0027801DA3|nr:peptidase inhibitor family I36 protein [Streptomyces canus]MDQ0598844.1 hypothetical protein [Streptomyces canus]
MKRLLSVAAGAVLAVAGLAGTSAASSGGVAGTSAALPSSVAIAAAPVGCDSGNLCFWNGENYTGAGPGELSGRNSNWGVFGQSACPNGTWSDCASSAYNNGVSCNAVMWTGTNYSGGFYRLSRGSGETQFASSHNNNFSSNSWISPSDTTTSACGGPNPFD